MTVTTKKWDNLTLNKRKRMRLLVDHILKRDWDIIMGKHHEVVVDEIFKIMEDIDDSSKI